MPFAATFNPTFPCAMPLDYATLELMRHNHPAWRLLCSRHVALIASFLQRVFIAPNVRVMAQADLVEALEDDLFTLRERLGPLEFPKSATEYLHDWAGVQQGWLRKFYRAGSDEPLFDLTPATEKTIAWLGTLVQRNFVGTESRMLTLFELLRQMSAGSQTDPALRLADLQRRRSDIDAEIARVQAGDLVVLGDTAVKERFVQFTELARELLTDFREVEQNFRLLDRRLRERIALWQGGRGALLQDVLGERDAIADSDQGRSFRAFWDFLMSHQRQQELTDMLDQVLALDAVQALAPDARIRRVHRDWIEAGEHTQRTVALLSQQLRRFLDDQAWLENRRIMDLLRSIEARAIAVRSAPPPGPVMGVDDTRAAIALVLERPLHTPRQKLLIASSALLAGEADMDAGALYAQVVVHKAQLAQHVRRSLQQSPQVTLAELCASQPLQHGLAELLTYLQLAGDTFAATVDESVTETIAWQVAPAPAAPASDSEKNADAAPASAPPDVPPVTQRQAHLPRVIFVR